MKYIFAFFLVIAMSVTGYSQTFQWAKNFGPSIDNERAKALTTDKYGNVYVTGFFKYTVDFDPGPNVYNLTSNGSVIDIFITKLDSAGNFIWAKKLGGTQTEYSESIKVDSSGNVYTTGYFLGTADFDPGAGVYNLASAGSTDIFISKLDSNGDFVWAKRIGDSGGDWGSSIALDHFGNVYTTGSFVSYVDFNPGNGGYTLISNGAIDIFVSKLDSNGNFVMAKNMGGLSDDVAYSIFVDNLGIIYTTGYYQYNADFNPNAGNYTLSAWGVSDIFISKIDNAGNFVSAQSMGGTGSNTSIGNAISVDNNGNVYITGCFNDSTDFNPGPNTNMLTSAGLNDIFVVKVDAAGIFQWAKRMGGHGNDIAYSLALDNGGNVYTTGYFTDTVDFNPGVAVYNLPGKGLEDIFISKLNTNGSFQWAKSIGSDNKDISFSIAVAESGSTYITGFFTDTADFDPGAGVYHLASSSFEDAFVQKYNYCGTNYNASYVDCDSVTLYGNTYNVSGNYLQQFTAAGGCDSNFILNITINSENSFISQTACDSYTMNGQTYNATGIYVQNFINALGCDSTISLNLSINNSSANSISQTACEFFTLNGQTYTASGAYTQTYVNAANCDSIVTLNLTIDTIDTSVTQTANVLSANESGATYQWLYCNPYQLVPGATNQTLYAPYNADYAVAITKNGCSDTSACFPVTGIGINDYKFSNIRVYPNPATQKLFIDSEREFQNAAIRVLSVTGEIVTELRNLDGNKLVIDMSEFVSGFYIVEISADGSKYLRGINKE